MKKLKGYAGSCKTKRGCNTDLDICPSDGDVSVIYSEMHGAGNGPEAILSASDILLDKASEETEIKIAA